MRQTWPTPIVQALTRHVEAALADAARWSQQPHGGGLAALRERDAAALRAMARERLA